MTHYFLGVDIGSTKSHACIADESGTILGFGDGRGGNHESVGYEGMTRALAEATHSALASAGILKSQITGAGFGVAGYDWHTERATMLDTIVTLGLKARVDVVNDAILGVIGGSEEGWGIGIVAGTGCNCRGRTRDRKREGMMTGAGTWMGEGAGSGELVQYAVQAVAQMWTRRGPHTRLAEAFVERTGARDLEDLIEGIINYRYELNAAAAALVIEVASNGDGIAQALVRRAGCELGEMAKAVIRQLDFQKETFDIVLIGSMFNAGDILIQPLRETVRPLAPHARFLQLASPPVVGAVLLGMEQMGILPTPAIRERLEMTVRTAPRGTRAVETAGNLR